jgi:hypothetical protein
MMTASHGSSRRVANIDAVHELSNVTGFRVLSTLRQAIGQCFFTNCSTLQAIIYTILHFSTDLLFHVRHSIFSV